MKKLETKTMLYVKFLLHTQGREMVRNFGLGVLFFVGVALIGFLLQSALGQIAQIFVFVMTNLIDNVFLLLVFWNSSRIFHSMHSRWTISLYHTLPVHQIHKYIVNVLLAIVFQALLFFLATLISYTILRLLFSGQLTIDQVFGFGNANFFPPYLQNVEIKGFGLLLLRYSTFNILYIFGAIFFRSKHFLKTTFFLLAFSILLSWAVFFTTEDLVTQVIFQVTAYVLIHLSLLMYGYKLLSRHSVVRLQN